MCCVDCWRGLRDENQMSDYQMTWELSHEIKRLKQEIASLQLTKSERFVLQEVRDIYANEDDVKCNEISAVIDRLLERTK